MEEHPLYVPLCQALYTPDDIIGRTPWIPQQQCQQTHKPAGWHTAPHVTLMCIVTLLDIYLYHLHHLSEREYPQNRARVNSKGIDQLNCTPVTERELELKDFEQKKLERELNSDIWINRN